ncbi:MAG: hypothetical protein NTZ90_12075 [Proteobacteria bacterium]|nr:hypothetical protein [Pseudomonadota bacterium]
MLATFDSWTKEYGSSHKPAARAATAAGRNTIALTDNLDDGGNHLWIYNTKGEFIICASLGNDAAMPPWEQHVCK